MTARRIEVPTHPNGSRKSFAERRNERRAAHHERQRVEREQKQSQKFLAQFQPPPPKPLTYDERAALRRAETTGQQIAAERAAERAALNAEPVNPYRSIIADLEAKLSYRPELLHRINATKKFAAEWETKRNAEKAEADRIAKLEADPMYQNAKENFKATLATAPPEDKAEVMQFGQLALVGDLSGYWAAESAYLRKVFERQDKLAVEKRDTKSASDAEFREHASQAEATRQQMEQAKQLATETLSVEG